MLGNCDPQNRNAGTLSSSNGCHVVHTIDQSLSSIESENLKEYWRSKCWAYAHVRFCVLCLWGNRSVTCHWNQCLETIWVRTLSRPPQPCCLTWVCGPSCSAPCPGDRLHPSLKTPVGILLLSLGDCFQPVGFYVLSFPACLLASFKFLSLSQNLLYQVSFESLLSAY